MLLVGITLGGVGRLDLLHSAGYTKDRRLTKNINQNLFPECWCLFNLLYWIDNLLPTPLFMFGR
jgi:hypothetical protein